MLRACRSGDLRVVNTGVRLFERDEAKGTPCAYRACHDGLAHTLPNITKQVVTCSPAAALRVLTHRRGNQLDRAEIVQHEPELATALTACQPGSVILVCTPEDGVPMPIAVLYAPSGSVGAMVKGLERQALQSCGNCFLVWWC